MVASTSLPRLEPACPCSRPAFADPLVRLLDELADVLAGLDDRQYALKPVGVIPGSIGGHVRHCLDHVAALLAACDDGCIDYDRRARGTPVETDRRAALDRVAELAQRLRELPDDAADRPIRVGLMLTADGGPPRPFRTSLGRELAYVVSHTIHHNAIIGAMVRTLGGDVPERFGYAPSTIAHARAAACVR